MRILLLTGLFVILFINVFSQSVEELKKKKQDAERLIQLFAKIPEAEQDRILGIVEGVALITNRFNGDDDGKKKTA